MPGICSYARGDRGAMPDAGPRLSPPALLLLLLLQPQSCRSLSPGAACVRSPQPLQRLRPARCARISASDDGPPLVDGEEVMVVEEDWRGPTGNPEEDDGEVESVAVYLPRVSSAPG